jgi:hypothetical protein
MGLDYQRPFLSLLSDGGVKKLMRRWGFFFLGGTTFDFVHLTGFAPPHCLHHPLLFSLSFLPNHDTDSLYNGASRREIWTTRLQRLVGFQ